MIRTSLLALALFGVFAPACKKEDKPEARATPPAAMTVDPDGVRHIPIEASAEGYKPAEIPGKPGEKLLLVFTRTVDASCMAELKTPDGKIVPLPMNQPVGVAVTVPQTGKVEFACGMSMNYGHVIAQPST